MSEGKSVSEAEVIPHHKLFEASAGTGAGGAGSKVFHLAEVPELSSLHDGRRKQVLLNRANTSAALLVDVVTVAAGSGSPRHYHKGTDHFFFILDGRGNLEIEGRSYPLQRGSVAWIADGDVHQVFADPASPLMFLEYFSRGDHETVFLGQACAWQPRGR